MHKGVSQDVGAAVVVLGAKEGVVVHWSFLIQLPRLWWKVASVTGRWSLLSSCAGLRVAAFGFLPLFVRVMEEE